MSKHDLEAEIGVVKEGREFRKETREALQQGATQGDLLDTPAVQV